MTATEAAAEPSRADLRRAQVIDAAMKCFARGGFHGASMADIAREAAMSVGHIYRYFENKEAIIADIVARDLEEALARIDAVRARQGDVVEEIIEILRFKAERVSDPARAALALEVLAEAARNPRMAALARAMDEAARAWLRDLLLRGGVTGECVEARLDMIAMLLEGWTPRIVKHPNLDREAYLNSVRIMLRFLLCEAEGEKCG
ncbi:MAG: TetR/AcrR family transcriptional regulator [Hyphomonadaceae bacterium]